MACELYNLVKEGDLKNYFDEGITVLGPVAINALYDGDLDSTVVTLSGAGVHKIALVAEFGEAFDMCHVDYYTDDGEPTPDFQVTYGTVSGSENVATISNPSSGLLRATLNTFARFIEIRHTVSGTVANIKQLEIVGIRNETLAFGTSKAEEQDYLFLDNSPVGTLSSSPNIVPLFNDSNHDETAKVAVAPTFTDADNYIHIGTTSSGTFYGINDFGFLQPGPNPLSLVDDTFFSTTLDSQWERIMGSINGTAITPTLEGLFFDTPNSQGAAATNSTRETMGIIGKEFFTAQSFTIEVEVKFLTITKLSVIDDTWDWFMILTNNYPIVDVGTLGKHMSDTRRGTSVGGIFMRPNGFPNDSTANLTHGFRWVDGGESSDSNPDSAEATERRWTNGTGNGFGGITGERGELLGPSLDDIADITNTGTSLGDLSVSAPWHTWRLVYDAGIEKMSAYVDNIPLGSRTFLVESFGEGCKLFIGIHTRSASNWVIRNFRVLKDIVYVQKNIALSFNNGTATATVSGLSDNVAKLIDNDNSTAYVGPDPTTLTRVRVDFDQPYDIVSYTLRQRDKDTGTAAFGKTYFPDVARNALVDFGGQQTISHFYPNTSSAVRRAPTFLGTATTLSGIQYIDFQFVDYDDTVQPDGALVIEELAVLTFEYVNKTPTLPKSVREFPWSEGRWNNLKHYGSSKFLALKDRIAPDAVYRPFPEYLVRGVDYQVSSAEMGHQFADKANDYGHPEVLFTRIGTTGAGAYVQWHSAVQTDQDFWVWRYFSESSKIKAVFWDTNTSRPSNVLDKFKFQYLITGGNPNNNNDWIDFPVITKPHPFTGGIDDVDTNYKDYKDYLIANNDGEFYTDYLAQAGLGNFDIDKIKGVAAIPDNYGIFGTVFNSPVSLIKGLSGLIEFDTAIFTQGIRLAMPGVVESDVASSGGSPNPNIGLEAFQIAFESLQVFRASGTGSYISPVFDTGTPQNTERLVATVRQRENTSSAVFVRSSARAPEQVYDTKYENWQMFSKLGSTQTPITVFFTINTRTIVREGKHIHLLDIPFEYDAVLDEWSSFDTYPTNDEISSGDTFEQDALGAAQGTVNTSPEILPDDRVKENAVILEDGNLYVACFSLNSNIRTPRVMFYQFTGDNIGWTVLDNQRPSFSEFCNMVGFEGHLYFFSRDGTISKYNVDTLIWEILGAILPLHTGGLRNDPASVLFENKVYIFGGNETSVGFNELDIFNLDTELFSIGSPSPFLLVEHQAVIVPEERVIYLLPLGGTASSGAQHRPAIKYYVDTDEYEILESMMWSRMATGGTGTTGGTLVGGFAIASYYYYADGFIYGVRSFKQTVRSRVVKDPWVHGKSHAIKDAVWGVQAATEDLSWVELSEVGELVPQERYFQFKVELYSDDRINTPILESVTIVTPQEILVPASGTSNVFVKIGVASDETYQAWYSGSSLDPGPFADHSILYTESAEGLTWQHATTASGVITDGIVTGFSVRSPWVIKNSISSYQFWFDRHALAGDSEIWYVTSTIASNFSETPDAQKVISLGVISQTENGVYQPCVIKNNPTNYEVFYTGQDTSDIKRIFYATSSDGITWGSHQLSLDIGNDTVNNRDAVQVYRPMVLKEGSTYRMWYTGIGSDGFNRILYTESLDGLTWDFPRLIIDIGAEGTLDTRNAFRSFVVKDETTYFIYYFGSDGGTIYLIRGSSPDGINFSNFSVAFPPGGLDEKLDSTGIEDFFTIVNRVSVIPGQLITTGRIKVYN